jgi:predicted nuclease of predicted toxin-antitoxin system
MKFLADMGVSMSTVRSLREQGHEAIHLREEGLRQLPDEKILEKARQEGRIVLTFDLDFGDLMVTGTHMFPSAVIFRLHSKYVVFASTFYAGMDSPPTPISRCAK